AYALIATPGPLAWLAWLQAILALLLIRYVTGIPPAEAQALRSRGDDYRAYQATTPALIPRLFSPRPRSTP
ncbi:MAG: DUF1295 domain-containing protein, partial [Planctomycetota bacterium]